MRGRATRRWWMVVVLTALLAASACGPRFASTAVSGGGGVGGDTSGGLGGGAAGGGPTGTGGSGSSGAGAGASGGAAGGGASGGAGASSGVGTSGRGASGSGGGGASGASGASGAAAGAGPSAAGGDVGPAPGVTKDSIKIGYLLPLTGAAPVPSNFDKGVNVYYNDLNAKGGIGGRKVQVVIADTQSDAQVGKDQAKKLIETDGVFLIVVLDRLENQQAIGAYLNGRHFPSIEIQTPANLPADQVWSFGVTIDHAVQGKLIADYMVRVLKASKVAIVYENTPALYPGRDAFSNEAKALGASVVYSQSIDGQGNDYSGEALALQQSGATVTWLYMAPTPAAKIANQAQAVGYHPTWFANSISWGFDLIFKVGPTALAGARAFSPWLPVSDPRTNAYQQAYTQQNPGSTPDDLGIVGWGVGEIVTAALKATGPNLGQNALRAALQGLHFRPDVWAPVAFGPGVREGANVIAVLKESGGRWVLDHDFTSGF